MAGRHFIPVKDDFGRTLVAHIGNHTIRVGEDKTNKRYVLFKDKKVLLRRTQLTKMGEKGTKDNIRRKKVTEEDFFKVVSCVNSVIGDMLTLIWHTGMRPCEVCEIRPYDILTDDPECWLYIPGRDETPVGLHKTTSHERIKVIPFVGDTIHILTNRINDFTSKKYIFKPKEAIEEVLTQKRMKRKTPISCGNKPGSNRKKHAMITPGDYYTNDSLNQACARGCIKADIEVFTPYDLRRTVATNTRATLGKEAAQTLLGHTEQSTTDIYLLEEVQEAMKVAKRLASNI